MIETVEIRDARDEARKGMGEEFDIKALSDRVIARGGAPLPLLRKRIRTWAVGR